MRYSLSRFMAERDLFATYRIRRVALRMRTFTVNELTSSTGASPETIYGFIHDLKQKGDGLFKTETLAAEGPGRPSSRYMLTARGIDFLAGQNVAVAKGFNESAFAEDPTLRSVSRRSRKARGAAEAGQVVKEGLHIKGEITGEEDLQVNGSIEGLIQLEQSKVTVLAGAKVVADIIAREVVIYGSVWGNVRGTDRVEIKKDGSLNGDITTARVMIEDGAFFKGSIEIDKRSEGAARKAASSSAALAHTAGARVAESH
jgi:cytoskeletal protein CcmA (bactofilin family)